MSLNTAVRDEVAISRKYFLLKARFRYHLYLYSNVKSNKEILHLVKKDEKACQSYTPGENYESCSEQNVNVIARN
jgi:hypothetical protein